MVVIPVKGNSGIHVVDVISPSCQLWKGEHRNNCRRLYLQFQLFDLSRNYRTSSRLYFEVSAKTNVLTDKIRVFTMSFHFKFMLSPFFTRVVEKTAIFLSRLSIQPKDLTTPRIIAMLGA